MLVLGWLGAAATLPAQQPNVHYLHHGVMPPGAIGSQQLQRGGPLPGFFQPVEIKAPPGALISLAAADQFEPSRPGPRKAGFLDRRRLSAAGDEHPLGRGAGSLSHHRGHRPPLCAARTRMPLRHSRRTDRGRPEAGHATASSSRG